jgi:hypothetical protein
MANSFPGSGQVQVDCLIFTSGGPMGFCSSGIACDGFPYARFTESWGIRFNSPDTKWILSTAGTFVAGYSPSGTDWGTGNMIASNSIGIGTTTPANALHIYRASGFATMALQVGGNYGYFLANGCCMGIASDAGATGIKFHINRQAPDDAMLITQAGNVGINCSAPSYKLHVNGTFYAAGSSIDYKQSICNYNTDSCMFMKLKPVTYQYKEEYCHLGKELKSGTQIGLIAEEVAETYPELAILVNEEENKVVRNVDYEKLSVILLSEVQKLRREVDDLKHKQ